MTQRISLTAQAHNIIKDHLSMGDIAIDATVGNGYDTVFLAQQVGEQGTVFGFDIQQQAIEATQLKLKSENISSNIKLIHCSHSKMEQYVPQHQQGKINTIMFNLGYLPGSDKSTITVAKETLRAVSTSLAILTEGGLMTIAAYPGHSGGDIETAQIKQWLLSLDKTRYTYKTILSSEKMTAPLLFVIYKTTNKFI